MDVTRVEVEIEELVLHGFARGEGAAVATALERALRTRLDADGGFGESRTLDRVEEPPIRLAAGASPRAVGRGVAERLHASLKR